MWSRQPWRNLPSFNETIVVVALLFIVRCSSFEEKWSLWRSKLWEGIWSCHPWRTLPSFNETTVAAASLFTVRCSSFEEKWSSLMSKLWEGIWSCQPWRTLSSFNEIQCCVLITTLFGIVWFSLEDNCSLWRSNLWEGMWSCHPWRTLPSFNETTVVAASMFTVRCSCFEEKWSFWRSKLWEGMWSCQPWRTLPSFNEIQCCVLTTTTFGILCSSLEDNWSLWRSDLWEGMWSCHFWRTLPSFNVTICIVIRTFQKYSGYFSLSSCAVSILNVASMVSIVLLITCLLHSMLYVKEIGRHRQRLGSHIWSKLRVFWRNEGVTRQSYIAHAVERDWRNAGVTKLSYIAHSVEREAIEDNEAPQWIQTGPEYSSDYAGDGPDSSEEYDPEKETASKGKREKPKLMRRLRRKRKQTVSLHRSTECMKRSRKRRTGDEPRTAEI